MVKKIEDLNFYELLEVSPTANSQDIHRAYERIRRIYEPNSIALYSLFTPEETTVINQRIEEAYRTLMYESHRRRYDASLREARRSDPSLPPLPVDPLFRDSAPAGAGPAPAFVPQGTARQQPAPTAPEPAAEEAPSPPPFTGEFTGQALKLLREQRKFTIKNIADMTKVGGRYLELIEEERFEKLPARPYLRGFLTLYAKALGYDPERVAADYLKRCEAALNPPKK